MYPEKGAGHGRCDGARPESEKVVVVMSHTDQKGRPKLTEACTLPLTAAGCVDMIITEKAVLTVGRDHFVLKELMNGSTIDEVIGLTDAEIIVDMPFS